jgi:hypothetical protein
MNNRFLLLALLATALVGNAQTISLVHFDGTNGSTTIVDEAGNTWTASGSAQISTTTAAWGQSAYFDGVGDFIRVDNASLFNFGSAPFTIDFWINPSNAGNNTYLLGRSNPNGGQGFDIRLDLNEILVVGANGWSFNIGTYADPTGNYISPGTWGHVAVVATVDTTYLFYNGNLIGVSGRSVLTDGGNQFSIGYQSNFSGSAYTGYIDELRISNMALWTANFTPPGGPGEIPEPSTYAALLGAVALGLALRRKRVAARI